MKDLGILFLKFNISFQVVILFFRLVILCGWIFCLVAAIPILVDESLSGPDIFDNDCNFTMMADKDLEFYVLTIGFFVLIPLVLMPYMHIHIAYTVYQTRKRVQSKSMFNILYHYLVILPSLCIFKINRTQLQLMGQSGRGSQ